MKLDQDTLKKLNPEHPALLCKTLPIQSTNMTPITSNEIDTEMIIDSIMTTADSTVEYGSGAH